MAEPAHARAEPHIAYHAGSFVIGLAMFATGWAIDGLGDLGSTIPGYAVSYLIPAEALLGIVLTVLLGLMAGRADALTIWHACLWMGGGLVLGWLALLVYGLGGAA